ncbi:DNA phosphorothioation-associated putative methyltransferase [Pseudonocardia sp. ICBG601]|uniref:DNA phosphorothioation-associated putative methyltransferase n=1 Tax=Pseudonocardia sp. ICBG601 TaxID=2846759 RepID=UPI001CF71303
MTGSRVARHKTALTRTALSRPVATALADGILGPGQSLFDYGCGKGDDIRNLTALGYEADGWDPGHRPEARRTPASVVNLGYVVNVIEEPDERRAVLQSAWDLTDRVLVLSARMKWDARDLAGRPMSDGLVTRTGTFQKFYEQAELAAWIEDVLGVTPRAAAPGIFYIFRDETDAQCFVASRVYSYRPRVVIDLHARYEGVKDVVEPLLRFMQHHARAPRGDELPSDVVGKIRSELGSVRQAQRLIRTVTDDNYWTEVTRYRRADLLTYVALSRFGGRPRFAELDRSLALDIRTLFGSYREVCAQADRLLAMCGDQAMLFMNARSSAIGKQTPSALYVHRSAVSAMPPVLQVYEGCARVLAGTVASANIIKLSVAEPQVSYLAYTNFERDAHPTLESAVTVNLRKRTVEFRDYSKSENPPLLHRKEEFLRSDDPRRPLYERLTRAEVRAGLYERPELIGTLRGWQGVLSSAGVVCRGHRLVRA